MKPSYSLTYFDVRGRAEPIRLLLSFLGQPFEDRSVTRETWPKEKAETPLGQLPYLIEQAGEARRVVPQTMAIMRHLAREHGIEGKNEAERLAADVAAETAVDARAAFSQLRFSPGWADESARAKFAADTAPVHLERLDKLLGSRHWFAAEAPTYADIVVFDTLDALFHEWPALRDSHTRLASFAARVRELPQLSKYLATRRAV